MTAGWSLIFLLSAMNVLEDTFAGNSERGYIQLSFSKFRLRSNYKLCSSGRTCQHEWSVYMLKPSESIQEIYRTNPFQARREVIISKFKRNVTFGKSAKKFQVIFKLHDDSYRNDRNEMRYIFKVEYPFRTRPVNSYVDVDYNFQQLCSPGYFSQSCDKYCVPQNNTNGHYKCGPNGEKVCLPQWTNPDSNCTSTCTPNPCLNNGSCTIVNQRVHCQCEEPTYGRRCELCRVYLDDNSECRPLPPTGEAVGQAVKYSLSFVYILGVLSAVVSIGCIVSLQDKRKEDTGEYSEDETDDVEGYQVSYRNSRRTFILYQQQR